LPPRRPCRGRPGTLDAPADGHPECRREVGRTDKERVDAVEGGYFVEVLESRDGLHLDDGQNALVDFVAREAVAAEAASPVVAGDTTIPARRIPEVR